VKHIEQLLAVAVASAALAVAQPVQYTVTDLGPASLSNPANPVAITNSGLIASAEAVGSAWHASLQFNKTVIDLAKAGGLGGPNSVAFDVNGWGQAAGEAEAANPDPDKEDFCGFGTFLICQPFVWQNGVMSALAPLKDSNGNAGRNAVAKGINIFGQVVGMAENTTMDSTCPPYNAASFQFQKYQFEPVIWANDKVQQLVTPGNDPDGVVFKINALGQAAGSTGTCTGLTNIGTYLYGLHATIWQNGSVIDLGNLGGVAPGFGNFAYDINNWGSAVGASGTSDGSFHAFFWSPATRMQDLGTVQGDAASVALAINDLGDVTGLSVPVNPNASPRAFLRLHGGTMVDLNSLIPAGSTLYLFSACAINTRGEIVGIALDAQGNAHGYLATPNKTGADSSAE
jgi:probable HAF family extracellular repeat protein